MPCGVGRGPGSLFHMTMAGLPDLPTGSLGEEVTMVGQQGPAQYSLQCQVPLQPLEASESSGPEAGPASQGDVAGGAGVPWVPRWVLMVSEWPHEWLSQRPEQG